MDGKGGKSESVKNKVEKIRRFISRSAYVLLYKTLAAFHAVPVITFVMVLGLIAGSVTGVELAECSERIHTLEVVNAENAEEEPTELHAQSAVLMDADSGRILFEKNGSEIRPMASTTKIMTCILALDYGNLEEEGTVSKEAAKQPKVRLGMREGQRFELRDLLYSLMLESHNDSAVAIAEHISGSVESFADLMNRKAKSIGLHHTHFVTPNGLDGENEGGAHQTTAEDLAAIMKYCIWNSPKRDLFLEITETNEYQFSDLDGVSHYQCHNHNAFLQMMDGAISGKTGFTSKAGYCYVGALKRENRCYIVALLGCGWPNHKNYKWEDTRKLMEYGLKNYSYQNVWKEIPTKQVKIADGVSKEDGIYSDAYVYTMLKTEEKAMEVLMKKGEKMNVRVTMQNDLKAPVRKYQQIGTVRYELGGKTWKVIPIVSDRTVLVRTFRVCAEAVLEKWMLNIININD